MENVDGENVVSFYPRERLSFEMLGKVNQKIPVFVDPHVLLEVIDFSIKSPNVGTSEIGPIQMNVNGKLGYYFKQICAPRCPIQFEVLFYAKRTLRLSLISDGKENVEFANKEFGLNLQDIDEDTFKTIISTLKFMQ